jgi:anti-sigma regulatory factor (Ser/Thr protein kinase)
VLVVIAPALEVVAHDPGPFEHLGLLYHDRDDYVAGTTAFVRQGRSAGDPVMVAVPGPNLDLIRGALGGDGDGVRFADMAVAGRNPGRIIPGVLLAFAAAHPGQRVWIIGEPIWPGRTEIEYPACAAHEALINAAFAGRDAAILCPYDVSGLDPTAVTDAARTHPIMVERSATWASPSYADPVGVAATFNRPLPAPPVGAEAMRFDGARTLAAVRRFVASHAAAAGLPADQVDELSVAINELATNSCEHADGAGRLSMWLEPGMLVCQVDDHGHFGNAMAGRIPPGPHALGGRGLIAVNLLCDLVRVHAHAEGTSIRVHKSLTGVVRTSATRPTPGVPD